MLQQFLSSAEVKPKTVFGDSRITRAATRLTVCQVSAGSLRMFDCFGPVNDRTLQGVPCAW
jgi:hypothetical protein